jgi:hypothetical protein
VPWVYTTEKVILAELGLRGLLWHNLFSGAFHFGTIAEGSGQPRGDCPYRMGPWAKVKCFLMFNPNLGQGGDFLGLQGRVDLGTTELYHFGAIIGTYNRPS